MGEGTNKKLVKDIASALETQRGDAERVKALRLSRSRGAIPATLGTGFEGATAAGGGGSGAGIQSPVSEPSAGTRTFHPAPRTVQSTDGIFTLELRDLKTIDMVDAASNVVQFAFAQPS